MSNGVFLRYCVTRCALNKIASGKIEQADGLKAQILASRNSMYRFYTVFCNAVNAINRADTDLRFCAETSIRKRNLYDTTLSIFDNRGSRAFKEKYVETNSRFGSAPAVLTILYSTSSSHSISSTRTTLPTLTVLLYRRFVWLVSMRRLVCALSNLCESFIVN